MFWLLTLPFRMVFGIVLAVLLLAAGLATLVLLPLALLVWLPVLLLRGGLRLLGGLLLVLILGFGAVLLTAVALLPLVPIVACLSVLWMAARLTRRPSRHHIVAS